MSEPFIGEIRTFPYTFAPEGWFSCDGQLIQIAQFTSLFAVIGTIYGGDGRTTFAMPPLNNRAAMGFGTGPGLPPAVQGYAVGANYITLVPAQLPQHDHIAVAEQDLSDQEKPTGSYVSIFQNTSGGGVMAYKESPASGNMVQMSSAALSTTGSGQSHLNIQPVQAFRFCMAWDGIFPSRS
ncbi:Tail fiber protein [Sulfidibacter corallicola]|uniref:Tail fiber protein n=1 Tax=Sulfidibacter corallicola TaxID=2818388 RepID=A0A8A4TLA1_SULCO|nr:tail fiber protein [Sulfidibacter corallicola]QTD50257.1 tail fiber protein [Sulfidibacter corallicola]